MRPIWGTGAFLSHPLRFASRIVLGRLWLGPRHVSRRSATMINPAIDLLLTRRSVSAKSLTDPGPNAAELELMLRSAARVPDHKKLVPWRFVLFQGEARAAFGKALAAICRAEEEDPGTFRLEN